MRQINDKIRKWCRSLDAKYLRPGYEPKYPNQINIETSGICNLRCACCPHGVARDSMRSLGIMSLDTFHHVLDHLDIPMKHAFLHMHGEPFLNPNLPNFVEELTQKQILVNLYSNCKAVDEVCLDAILSYKHVSMNFSADLLGKDYYESIRGGACYEETLEKLKVMNDIFERRNMFFNIVIIMDSRFVNKAEEVIEYCESLYNRFPRLNGILLGSKFPWPRLPFTGDLAGNIEKTTHRCTHAFDGLNILWNGDATMCSFDYTGECVVGSLIDNTYSEVFNNSAARRFRMLHWRHQNVELPLCKDCLMDRYVPASVKWHRAMFLKQDYHEKKQTIESFFRF